MKTIEITKKSANGVEVIVAVTYGMKKQTINADGDIIDLGDKFEKSITTRLIKDGVTVEFDRFGGMTRVLDWERNNYSKAPKGAYARIGDSYVSEQTWNAREEALAEINAQIEEPATADENQTTTWVKNPAYAHMTDKQIKAAEVAYDNLQNEGYSDGNFNPYRDHLYIQAD